MTDPCRFGESGDEAFYCSQHGATRASIYDWRCRRASRHEPGDHHRYRIECEVCGQRGTIRLSIDPDLASADGDSPGGAE